MKKVLVLLAIFLPGIALAQGHGPAGGGFGGTESYPFPVTAGNDAACYDAAMAEGNAVSRYDDWQATHPGKCETLWEDVPDERRS